MKQLVLATGNLHKQSELAAMLRGITVKTLRDFPELTMPPEDGETFEANAELKARFVAEALGLPALADDSGLEVRALGDRPGVHSARYAPGSDADRNAKLLSELDGVTDRRARFVSALCFAVPGQPLHTVRGEVRGEIGDAPVGSHGFGYDPIFRIEQGQRAMAELDAEEKAKISHRGEALRRMLPRLHAFFA